MRIGIDVGGTKIEAAALDERGALHGRRRVPSPQAATMRRHSRRSRAWSATSRRELGEAAPVGLGIPGTLSPATGLVKGANSTWLIGRPLDRDLAARLGRPVRIANDANCFALSEAVDGAGRRRQGRVRRHPRHRRRRRHGGRRPGPHRPQRHRRRVGPQSPALAARRRAAGPGLLLRQAGLHRDVPVGTRPRRATAAAAAGRRAGRSTARRPATRRHLAAFERYEDRLARGLGHVINILDPDVDRAGRRPVQHRAPGPGRRAAPARLCLLRPRRHAGRAGHATATPAACAAPPGCGRRRDAAGAR